MEDSTCDSTRTRLLLTLKTTLSMLPRYLRHDLLRTCQPQHGRAVDTIAEMIAAKVDEGFEVETRASDPAGSIGDRVQWTKESG